MGSQEGREELLPSLHHRDAWTRGWKRSLGGEEGEESGGSRRERRRVSKAQSGTAPRLELGDSDGMSRCKWVKHKHGTKV